ncbi:hypothetical protein [Sphingomonas sp. CFBP 13720]|uniref:hypothetical protein n=1 Tax=Sphingomonas sp. CFBP 13720 TaxID=2775302 RepID=UPI00177B2A24|nr:hypothetical protein [Sphingomonas sp. CFBP 13720]MBD8677950.1 hypothetical protein [Sphingomonas sp. CFBP 13720]
MQTPFITDLRAAALTPIDGGVVNAVVSLKYFDQDGRHAGTSVILAGDLAEQARALLAFAEATVLHAAGADGADRPPHHHFPIMQDLRIGALV